MADGYSGWALLGFGVICGVAGYKLVPWMRRVEETEKLENLAQRVVKLASREAHRTQGLEILNDVQKYRQGVLNKTEILSDEEHTSKMTKLKNGLKKVASTLSPFSSNGKHKAKKPVEVVGDDEDENDTQLTLLNEIDAVNK